MKNKLSKMPVITLHQSPKFLALALLCAATAPAIAGDNKQVDPPATDLSTPWEFNLALPGWLANTSGVIGVDGHNAGFYLSAENLIKHLDMVASVSASARKGRFGIYGDLLYISASDGIGTDGIIKKLDVRLDLYIADMELNYRLLQGPKGFLDVRAGVRYTNLYNKNTITPNDEVIDQASTDLVNEVSKQLRSKLSNLDVSGRLRSVVERGVSGKLTALDGSHPTVPSAPVAGGKPGRLDAQVQAIFSKRAASLTSALQAERDAKTDALRAAAQAKTAALRKSISNEIASKLKSGLDTTASLAEDWWDPYVGLAARYNLGKAFYLTAKGDIGGFGVGSELTWQASGALGCQLSRYIYAEAGYRYLYTDYNKNGFVYDVTQSGAQITIGITF